MSAILSILLSVVLFTFNYYQSKRGASVTFLADGVLNEGQHKKHN